MIFPLAGNDKIRLSVTNFIAEKRIPHAIIIEGESGTGKSTLAVYLAKAAVCSGENPPCRSCKNCNLVESVSHPDITVIEPEDNKKNISVSQIRDLRSDAYIKPHQAAKRVFIIEQADTLNPQAQNALLKVLEEPPETVMFVLCVKSKSALLETIISRCVVLSLSSPEFSVAFGYIKNSTDFPENEIKDALASSKNNIGKALEILNGNMGTKAEISAKEFLEAMIKADSLEMLSVLSRFEKNRVETDKFINGLKYTVANKIRENTDSFYAKPLMAFYNSLRDYEQSLATNINLNLLFCSMTCKAVQLFGGANDRSYIG